MLNNVKVSSP